MRKFRRLPKPAMLRIKHLECRFLNRRNHSRRHPPAPPRKRFRLRNRTLHHLRLLHYVAMLLRIRVGNAQQHATKAGTPIAIARRKISSAIKGLAIRRKKRRQRPPALPAHRLYRRLIPAVNVRTLVPIHLHRNEMLIHNRRNLRIRHTTPGPSHGTSGTTPPQYPAASACSPAAPRQTPPRPTHATEWADASQIEGKQKRRGREN